MGILAKKLLKNFTLADWDKQIKMAIIGTQSNSGITVNESTAMRFTAVFACIRVLAETLASTPIILYRDRKPGDKSSGKDRAAEHPLYDILKSVPNRYMPSFTFKETMMGHIVTSGNCYAQIIRNRRGQVTELNIIPWTQIEPEQDTETGEIRYKTNDRGKTVYLPFEEVFHIPGLGFDGIKGYSPIRMAMEAVGLGLAAETFAAKFYGQGTHLGGVLEHPGKLGDQAHKNLKSDFEEKYAGIYNSHKVPILEEGMTFKQLGIKPEEAQFIETRKFQIEEIARIYRVPLHLLQNLDRATNNNIEHQSLEFVMYTMLPWFARWEQYINFKLLTKEERQQGYFAEFLINALLRGDTKSRAMMLQLMRQNGVLNADEWRELENMNPQEGGLGKIYFINGAMVPVETAAQQKKPNQNGGDNVNEE
ncbi:phage portal protein [Thermanaerosceptrum fracticalcis]|uniref:Phage portal protein n=1 Tax=Thermanaerosceptrum fracticalcis TaxID=1712410 RepID=A0A7G6E7Z6_THEFR|nr:phage portal protein [Thermanaerosceptrum fracticalcis]QNB48200.1 phage portal protein [Thermanaerosceptrum fracticalcis]